jgi:hypothetical protein
MGYIDARLENVKRLDKELANFERSIDDSTGTYNIYPFEGISQKTLSS